jgi:hypothetical protein
MTDAEIGCTVVPSSKRGRAALTADPVARGTEPRCPTSLPMTSSAPSLLPIAPIREATP